MSNRPLILLTNDDGIHAAGIRHLWEAVSDLADIAIVAPDQERSGCGLSITWTKPLQIRPFPWDAGTPAWSLNGTPADCVKMACSVLLDRKPHMVLSGINKGSNAGRTVLYSGTVGGIKPGETTLACTLEPVGSYTTAPRRKVLDVIDPSFLIAPGAKIEVAGQTWIIGRQ